MDRPLVVAHAPCADGFTALWLANQYFWNQSNDGQATDLVVDYHPGIYGQFPPDTTERDVFILDFSYPPELLRVIADVANSVVVIDHHESAIRKLQDFEHSKVTLILDTSRSGAYLTSKYFWPNAEPMTMVKLVDDRDRWVFADSRTRPFHASLFSRPYKIGEWNKVSHDISTAVNEGIAMDRKHHKDIEELLAQTAHLVRHGEMVVAVANMSYIHASDAGHKMLEMYPGADFAATYFAKNDLTLSFSLRSRKDGVNVAKIAESFGGGGHPSAAGFTAKSFPFEPMPC